MSNDFDHLHLKRNTAGSSNELSFDVLDAASADVGAKRDSRGITSPVITRPQTSKDSYHGVKGQATLSKQDEVVRRKRARRNHAAIIGAICAVVVLIAIGAAVYFGTQYYQSVQGFSERFDGLVQRFVKADECLTSVDALMADPTNASEDVRQSVLEKTAGTISELEQLKEQVEVDRGYAVNERDETALGQVIIAADARLSMIDVATRTIETVDASNAAADEANAIWNDILDADQAARKATQAANKADDDEAITEARDATAQSRSDLDTAYQRLQVLSSSYEGLDFSAQTTYLETRLDALDHAIATGDALLEGKSKRAVKENNAYNKADKKAADLAEKLPLSPQDDVDKVFVPQLQELQKEYETARNQAIEADSLIREYHG